ncbi:killer cell lectin-like receptor subfamily F member 1 isoform X1 [Gopherus flavomarginatus]|uniref:killer cell lectin-like receptor subfamily F member 1 isoform X1 n=1 Tax=Gopherus flavomarginatus TaxID=286002 RepID=UPI0021CBECF7|nr:killer cell lectin-like receptor subfamily F member 1 isoform X1 [Gopherus flavomarginatus]
MAGEIVYADLNIRGDSSLTIRPQPPHHLSDWTATSQGCKLVPASQDLTHSCIYDKNIRWPECHHFPHWHQMALRVSWAANVILLGAMTALSVWVFQGPCSKAETGGGSVAPESDWVTRRNGNGTDCNSSLASHLRRRLCDSPQNSLAGPPGCRLCAPNWLLHGDKCYWLSKESKKWNESREDCLAKSSQMLMSQDQREMAFIKTITEGKYSIWIGLHLTTSKGNWTWVDGSLLNQTGVSLSAPDTGNSCGVWKENQIRSEICSGSFKWICQREAVPI